MFNRNKIKKGKPKQFKLQTKLFLIYIIFSETIVLSFALFFYQYMAGTLINNKIDALHNLNSGFIAQVDSMLEDLDYVSANINYSNRVIDKLSIAYDMPFTNTRIQDLAELLATINGTDLKSHQINIYDLKGNVARVGMVTNTKTVDLQSLDWFKEAIALNGLKYISVPYQSSAYSYTSSEDWYISLYRAFKSPFGETIGAIETVKRCNSIFKSILSYERKENGGVKTYIFNGDGVLIYPYIEDGNTQLYDSYYSFISEPGDEYQYINPISGHKEYLIHEVSSYSNWTFLSVEQASVVLAPANSLLTWIAFIVGIIFLLTIVISYLLARNMIKPIKSLKKIMQKQAIDTLGEKVDENFYTSYAELAEVYEDYSNMCGKLQLSMNELIETRHQEIKARMRALQAQTNPHFFYNTLSNIIVLSENAQNKEIIQLCKNLTKLMRYITDMYVNNVTIREEIEYVEKYLYCMKVRYQSSLVYEYDIDEALLDISIPKLIIQPLVENAIKHGTDCIPPWKIQITGKKTKSGWYISIIDSGNGFSPDVLNDLTERINAFQQTSDVQIPEPDGFGLMNVYIRLKYFLQDALLFELGNTADGHGYVTIGSTGTQTDKSEEI